MLKNSKGICMKKLSLICLSLVLIMTVSVMTAQAKERKGFDMKKIEVFQNGSIPSVKGPAEWFTGAVRVDSVVPNGHESNISLGLVTFEPGSRTAWHTHSKGQLVLIMSGVGLVQQEGGEIIEVHPGDAVWFPANVKHWHGASKDVAMTHYSIINLNDNNQPDWLEHVSDKEYNAK